MNLQDIKDNVLQEVEALDYQAAADKLNGLTVTTINTKSWTIGDLAADPNIGMEAAAMVSYTIEKAGVGDTPQAALMRGLFVAINTSGVTLHTPERQLVIDSLAAGAGWPTELTTAVKEAGIKVSPKFQTTITALEVQTIWEAELARIEAEEQAAALVAARLALKAQVKDLYNSTVAPVLDGATQPTKELLAQAFKDVATALEA